MSQRTAGIDGDTRCLNFSVIGNTSPDGDIIHVQLTAIFNSGIACDRQSRAADSAVDCEIVDGLVIGQVGRAARAHGDAAVAGVARADGERAAVGGGHASGYHYITAVGERAVDGAIGAGADGDVTAVGERAARGEGAGDGDTAAVGDSAVISERNATLNCKRSATAYIQGYNAGYCCGPRQICRRIKVNSLDRTGSGSIDSVLQSAERLSSDFERFRVVHCKSRSRDHCHYQAYHQGRGQELSYPQFHFLPPIVSIGIHSM